MSVILTGTPYKAYSGEVFIELTETEAVDKEYINIEK